MTLARVPVPARIVLLMLLLLAIAAAVLTAFHGGPPGPHLAMLYDGPHTRMLYD